MIIDDGGKYRTVRTQEEEKEMLLRELRTLNDQEKALLKAMLRQMTSGLAPNEPSLIDVMGNAEFKVRPVDMETFVRDEHYLGITCGNIYPRLLEDLKNVFDGGYNEVIFTGAIGVGKSFSASIGMCRILYELSCMKNPHKSFGLAPNSNISLICLGVNETQAIKVAFENIVTKIELSPYFETNFPFKRYKKEIKFPSSIMVAARASTDTSVLGLNPIGAMMDETNFLQKPVKSNKNIPGGQNYDQAEALYSQLKRRMRSRFEKRGRLPAVMFLSSSKNTFDDFTSRRIREAVGDPKIYVADYTLWEVRPQDFDIEGGFHVLCGNETSPSRILDPEDLEEAFANLPEGAAIVKIPSEFRGDFERDLEGSIRDIAGRSTAALSPFITRREKIKEMEEATPGRVHPFSTEVYDMSKGGRFLWDRMVTLVEEVLPSGAKHQVLRPIVSPQQVRHVHIDPSLKGDSTGLCMAHVCGWTDVVRRNEDMEEYTERAPVYFLDLILQIIPPLGREIILADVRRMVYDLSAHGYIITSVTQDSYQSADSLQQLRAKGYSAELLSVDVDIAPYDNLKLALYENRILGYPYPKLRAELRSLEKNAAKNKVDHPPGGSKDLSDALAGTLFTLSGAHRNMPLPLMTTSSFTPLSWVDPGYAAMQGGGMPGMMGHSPGLGTLPPFLTSNSDGWDPSGWDPGSL